MASRGLINIPPFSQGLNTENNQLLDLPTYTSDELNCKIFPDGTRGRRLGIDYEPGYVFNTDTVVEPLNASAFSSYEWKKPGKVYPTIRCLQQGRYITFYGTGPKPFSQYQQEYILDLDKYKIDNDYYKYPVTYTDAYGILYITGEHINCIKLIYDGRGTYTANYAARGSLSAAPAIPSSGGNLMTFWELRLGNVLVASRSWLPLSIDWNQGVNTMIDAWNNSANNQGIQATLSRTSGNAWDNFITFTAPFASDPTIWNGKQISLYTGGLARFGGSWNNIFTGTTYSTLSGGRLANVTVKEFNEATFSLKFRDKDGLDDGLKVDELPTTNIPAHMYNLLNQGWTLEKITAFQQSQNKYPSNAFQWFAGKNASGAFVPADLMNIAFGTTQSPKGHYILDYFQPDRASPSGQPVPVYPPLPYRVTDAVFWAGRIFYLVGSTVLYTQILSENSDNCSKCYQDADPTSEKISDLIETDGGTIFVPNIGRGTRLRVVGGNLLIVGDKGIFAVAGTANGSFSAKGFSQYQVSTYGSTCPLSFVETESGIFYWSNLGVCQIVPNPDSGGLQVQNIIENSIQTFYANLQQFSIENAKGIYNKVNKLIYWFYPTDSSRPRRLDSALILDLRRGSWLKWKISDTGSRNDELGLDSPCIVDMMQVNDPFKSFPALQIFAGDDKVYVNDEPLLLETELDNSSFENVIFIALDPLQRRTTFAEIYDKNFKDWTSGTVIGEGNDFKSYLLSTPLNFQNTGQDGGSIPDNYRNKQTPYILTTFKRTEEGLLADGSMVFPSGCFGSTRWEWSTNVDSFRWDSAQQLYRPEKDFMNFRYVQNKTRARGTGKAMQIYLESDGAKDFRLHDLTLDTRKINKW